MGKPIAVEGVQFEIYEGGVLNPNGTVLVNSGSITSSKDTIQDKKVYAGSLLVDVVNFTSSLITGWVPSSGATAAPVPIVSTATKTMTEAGVPFLEGDQATAVVVGQIPSGSGTQPASAPITVRIKSGGAGQNVVNAT